MIFVIILMSVTNPLVACHTWSVSCVKRENRSFLLLATRAYLVIFYYWQLIACARKSRMQLLVGERRSYPSRPPRWRCTTFLGGGVHGRCPDLSAARGTDTLKRTTSEARNHWSATAYSRLSVSVTGSDCLPIISYILGLVIRAQDWCRR